MARAFFQYLENVSDFMKVAQSSLRFEVFRNGTYCDAGDTSATIQVAEKGGFNDGDKIWIGTNTSQTISDGNLPATGDGDIVISGAGVTYAANDAVAMHTAGGGSANDGVATFYDTPEMAAGDAVSQPITPDANNQVTGFLPAGSYVVRWSTAAGATLRLDHEVVTQETDAYQVPLAHDSASAGITEAVNKLDASALGATGSLGGRVTLGDGNFDLTAALSITQQNVIIEGNGPSTVIRVTTDANGIVFDGSGDAANGISNVTIKNLRIIPTTQNSNALLLFKNANFNVNVENVRIDGNGLANTGDAIKFLNTLGSVTVTNLVIEGIVGTSSFARGIEIDQDAATIGKGISFHGGRVNGCAIGARIANASAVALPGVSFHGMSFFGGAAVGTHGVQLGNLATGASLHGCHIDQYESGVGIGLHIDGAEATGAFGCRFTNCTDGVLVSTTGSVGVSVQGCNFDTIANNGIQIDAGGTEDYSFLGNAYTGTLGGAEVSDSTTASSKNAIISHGADDKIEIDAATIELDGAVQFTGDVTIGTFLNIGNATETTITIASGSATITKSYHLVATQSGDSSDELNTIVGGATSGNLLVLSPLLDEDTVIVTTKGNMILNNDSDFHMFQKTDAIFLIYSEDAVKWMEIARSGSPDSFTKPFFGTRLAQPITGSYTHTPDGDASIDLTTDTVARSDTSFLDITGTALKNIENGVAGQMIWLKATVGESNVLVADDDFGSGTRNIKLPSGTNIRTLYVGSQNAMLLRSDGTSWYEVLYTNGV